MQCFADNLPSSDWASSFLKRHKEELKLRTCQNIKSARAAVSADTVSEFIDNIGESMKTENGSVIPPQCVFNYGETNLSNDPGTKKVESEGVRGFCLWQPCWCPF